MSSCCVHYGKYEEIVIFVECGLPLCQKSEINVFDSPKHNVIFTQNNSEAIKDIYELYI